ncbi:unnamed protein product, partial [Vitis vinifera]
MNHLTHTTHSTPKPLLVEVKLKPKMRTMITTNSRERKRTSATTRTTDPPALPIPPPSPLTPPSPPNGSPEPPSPATPPTPPKNLLLPRCA